MIKTAVYLLLTAMDQKLVVVKYYLVKIQDGGNLKRKWSTSGSLSLLLSQNVHL